MVRINEVPDIVMALGIGAVFGVVMLILLGNLQTTANLSGVSNDSVTNAIAGIGNIFAQYSLVGTIVGLAIIVGIVVVLWQSFGGRQ